VADATNMQADGTRVARAAAHDVPTAALATVLGAVAVAVTVALIVSRRPDALSNPQFWAEGGGVFYQQAHNDGVWQAALTPWTGYFQTFSRLTAALSLAFDLARAPLVFAVAAILAQALAPLFLLSGRMAEALPDRRVWVLAALLWIGLPNAFEIQIAVTNVQTHLALLALLIVLADPPRTRAWRVFDVFFVILGGLSGPTCVLLVPIALLTWWRRGGSWPRTILIALLFPASVQALTYLTTGTAARFTTPLGASVARLLEIVGGQVFFAGTFGVEAYAALTSAGATWAAVVSILASIAGLAFAARALAVSRSFALRMFVLFATLALTAALLNPAIDTAPRWLALRLPWAGGRYFAPPILAWLAVLLWSACVDPSPRWRWGGRTLLILVLLIGVPRDWRVPARVDLDFPAHAARYAAAPAGTMVRIPTPPAGWEMWLRKRSPARSQTGGRRVTRARARSSAVAVQLAARAHRFEQGRVARSHDEALRVRRTSLHADRLDHPILDVVRRVGDEHQARHEAPVDRRDLVQHGQPIDACERREAFAAALARVLVQRGEAADQCQVEARHQPDDAREARAAGEEARTRELAVGARRDDLVERGSEGTELVRRERVPGGGVAGGVAGGRAHSAAPLSRTGSRGSSSWYRRRAAPAPGWCWSD